MNISAILEPETGMAIAEYSPTAAKLAELRSRLADVAYDVTTTKGMDIARRDRAEVRDLRVALEKKRVELKAPALERSRLIDTEAKRITAELEELEKPIHQQIKAEEDRKEQEKQAKIAAEFGRVQAIQEAIADIHMTAMSFSNKPSAIIAAGIEAMRAAILDPLVYQEHLPQAKAAHQAAIDKLEVALKAKQHDEAAAARLVAERAELDELRRAAAAQKAKEEAAAAELARAERARIAAERVAAEAEQKRLDAEAAAARKEADRIAAEARAQAQEEHEARMKVEQAAAVAAKQAADAKALKELARKRKAEAAETKLRNAAAVMLAALQGLMARHGDGSNEQAWAEWDTAAAAIKEAVV